MALWALMWQYGFISGLWLSLAIISIPRGYIVSEPLLALRSGVEDLIYLSQGLRDHPVRLLYRIIPGPLVLSLKGGRKRRCNMQLHTCQTVLSLVIPEDRSTHKASHSNASRVVAFLAQKTLCFCLFPQRM